MIKHIRDVYFSTILNIILSYVIIWTHLQSNTKKDYMPKDQNVALGWEEEEDVIMETDKQKIEDRAGIGHCEAEFRNEKVQFTFSHLPHRRWL